VQDLPGAAVFTFDYERYASRWVTNEKIGIALGKSIDCLNELSDEKVIVVGHSMGGLATRQALTEVDGLEDKISQVITFGTPNTGSVAAAIAAGSLAVASYLPHYSSKAVALFRAWMAQCGNEMTADMKKPSALCPSILPNALKSFDSEAARALRSWSTEMGQLPSWPSGLPVHALAGETRFDVAGTGFFLWKKKESVGMGDLVVTLDSATAGATDSQAATCHYDLSPVATINDGLLVNAWKIKTLDEVSRNSVDIFTEPIPCFHGNLMREASLAGQEFGLIAEDIGSRAPATEIITLMPWADGTIDKVGRTYTNGECQSGSNLTEREDAFRCFANSWVIDPCFSNPSTPTDLLCTLAEDTVMLADATVETFDYPKKPADEGSAFRAVLHDGTVCDSGSGAGPRGVEGYPYWFGQCSGPTEGIWRSREVNDDSLVRLYDRTANGTYFVAISVGDEQSPAQLFPVKTAYR